MLTTLADRLRMLRCLLILPFLALAGCNMPSADFRGLSPIRITVQGSTFEVRQKGNRAEAIRVNPQYAPRIGPIHDRAAVAMARVSGCRVAGVSGDQAQIFGRLDCGNGAAAKPAVPLELDCVPLRGSGIAEIGQIRVDLDCDPA